jgi:hypothetical protein
MQTFAAAASRLAGLAGALIGWPPETFWQATPAELASILAALSPPDPGLAQDRFDRLKEKFPDG